MPTIEQCLVNRYEGQSSPWYVCQEATFGERRADVVAWKVGHSYQLDLIEVKRSRQDWAKELESNKWRDLFEVGTRYWFASPKDIIQKDEVPDGCGLYHVNPSGKRARVFVVKQAKTFTDRKPDLETYTRLLLKLYHEHRETVYQLDRVEKGNAELYETREKLYKLDRVNTSLESKLERNPCTNPEGFVEINEFYHALGISWYDEKERTKAEVMRRLGMVEKIMNAKELWFEKMLEGMEAIKELKELVDAGKPA